MDKLEGVQGSAASCHLPAEAEGAGLAQPGAGTAWGHLRVAHCPGAFGELLKKF